MGVDSRVRLGPLQPTGLIRAGGITQGKPKVEWREDKVRMGMVLARKGPMGFRPVSSLNPDTGYQPMLCYIAPQSVERFVEMLPEGSSARPPLPRDGVSVA